MTNHSVAIIGKGAWGKAMYHVVSQNAKHVRLVGRGEEASADVFILAVPTQSLRDVREILKPRGTKPIIINTAKGIERLTHLTPHDIIAEKFPHCQYYALLGPSFADEVVNNMPTVVNLGYVTKSKNNETIRNLIQTDYFRVKLTRGVTALEIAGALKNVYAIGCGLAEGLGYKQNTRIQLIMLAIEEVQHLFKGLGLTVDRFSLPGTLGDLVLTCNSSESRNFRFGKFLAEFSPEESLDKVGSTVEGYSTLNSLRFLELKAGVSLPLATLIKHVSSSVNTSDSSNLFESFLKKS